MSELEGHTMNEGLILPNDGACKYCGYVTCKGDCRNAIKVQLAACQTELEKYRSIGKSMIDAQDKEILELREQLKAWKTLNDGRNEQLAEKDKEIKALQKHIELSAKMKER